MLVAAPLVWTTARPMLRHTATVPPPAQLACWRRTMLLALPLVVMLVVLPAAAGTRQGDNTRHPVETPPQVDSQHTVGSQLVGNQLEGSQVGIQAGIPVGTPEAGNPAGSH